MLLVSLILLVLGVPLQLTYCLRLILTRGKAEPRWYYAAMVGGACNVLAGLLVRDPLLVTGQAALMCIYSLTRPKPAQIDGRQVGAGGDDGDDGGVQDREKE